MMIGSVAASTIAPWCWRGTALLAAAVSGCMALAAPSAAPPPPLADLGGFRQQPAVLVRGTAPGGPVELVTFDRRTRAVLSRRPVALSCERLHAGGGRIACMRYNRQLSGASQIDVLDTALKPLAEHPIQSNAVVSRTRLSADGRYAASTVFVSGHSYAVPGQFSTMTHIWDVRERRMALAFDKLALTHEGQPVPYTPQTQLNYWGVTFDPRDPDRFYLTVSIRKRPYLAEGSVSRASARTVLADVECPSLSPDGTRIAFKKLRANRRGWDPAVLDLRTGAQTVFAAAKGLDDQIEWLDEQTLIYEATETRMGGAKTDLMLLDLSQPQPQERLWLRDAASPTAARPVAER